MILLAKLILDLKNQLLEFEKILEFYEDRTLDRLEPRNKDEEHEIHSSYRQFQGIRVSTTTTKPCHAIKIFSFMEGRLFLRDLLLYR